MHAPHALALLATLALAAPAMAQVTQRSAVVGTTLQTTPYGGYMIFGSFIDGPLGTSLSSSAAPVYGAQLALPLAPGLALVGNVAHAAGDLEVGIPLLGGISVGSTSALMFDGGLQLSLPTPKTSGFAYVPFVQAGVGAMRWNLDLGSDVLQTTSTSLVANLGAGLDLPLGSSLAVRLMAKDYVGKFDFQEATTLDLQGKTAHNWALTAGLRLDF